MRINLKTVSALLCIVVLIAMLCSCSADNSTNSDETYRVTFHMNYAGAPAPERVAVKSGEKVSAPQAPSREGYVFDAWYTETAQVNKYDFNTPVSHRLTLFAGWKQSSAAVAFYLDRSSPAQSITVKVGDRVSKPADPVKEGYVFEGWYSDSIFRTPYDFSQEVAGDITLYAKWAQIGATVSLNLYDNVAAEPIKVEMGAKLPVPEIPTREDYVFTAWYTDAQRTAEFNFDTPVLSDMTLFAGWRLEAAVITYDYNYTDSPATFTAKVKVGEAVSEPPVPVREGYDFTGWYRSAACTDKFDFSSGAAENTTVFAGWTLKTFTVTFDWNFEGSVPTASAPVSYGGTLSQPTEVPANGTNVLVGWTLDKEGTADYSFSTPVTSSMTLYAKWAQPAAQENTVRFHMNDGTDTVYHTIENARLGGRIVAPAEPVRSGYYFAGWENGAGSGKNWSFTEDRVQGSVDLYAVWLKGYSFEAEYTDISGKLYHGWSDDGDGSPETLISKNSKYKNGDEMGVSNDYFIYAMLYNGASLEFHITAEKDVSNAVLVLRLAPDGYDYELNDETYHVLINGKRLQYGHLCMPIGNYRSDDMNDVIKPPFVNYLLTGELELKAGDNLIRLMTNNNNGHDGTYNAETPYVDCITIYSGEKLSWTEGQCHPENVGHTMDNVTCAVNFEGEFDTNRDHSICPLGNN